MAARLALSMGRPTLVVCKKISIPAWDEVFEDAKVEDFAVINYEKLTMSKKQCFVEKVVEKGKKPKFKWIIPKNALIIFDEAQSMAGENSLTSRLLISAVRQGFHIHLASATIAENPMKMFALGYALGFHQMTNWHEFLKANGCSWDDEGYGGWTYAASSEAMIALGKRMIPAFGIRLRKDELDCFPERTIEAELIQVELEQVQRLAREMSEEIEKHNLVKVNDKDPENAFTMILRQRQEAELLKVPFIVKHLMKDVANGFSVCVFVNFTQTLRAIESRVSECITIIGGQDPSERSQAIARFQKNEVHIALANIAAGGVSISLHDLSGRPRKSYISPSFSAIQVIQAVDRIHRANGMSPAHITLMCLAETAEEGVYRAVRHKARRISELNDGDLQSPYLPTKKTSGPAPKRQRAELDEKEPTSREANSSLLDRFF